MIYRTSIIVLAGLALVLAGCSFRPRQVIIRYDGDGLVVEPLGPTGTTVAGLAPSGKPPVTIVGTRRTYRLRIVKGAPDPSDVPEWARGIEPGPEGTEIPLRSPMLPLGAPLPASPGDQERAGTDTMGAIGAGEE